MDSDLESPRARAFGFYKEFAFEAPQQSVLQTRTCLEAMRIIFNGSKVNVGLLSAEKLSKLIKTEAKGAIIGQ